MTETVATVARLPRRAFGGILSNLVLGMTDGVPVATATLTTVFQDKTTIRSLTASGDVVARVQEAGLLVEGEVVKFYGEVGETAVTVLGPDLTKRTLARQAAKSAAPAKADKPKRPQTEAQKKAWREQILPKLRAGRARKAADGETAQAA